MSTTSDIFDLATSFEQMGLGKSVLQGVEAAGFKHPTDIQAKLIGPILEGRDVMGQARTGTGKTAAFALPILQLADPKVHMQALVLVPTRELAAQVTAEIDELSRFCPIKAACIIGGESIRDQIEAVRKGAHILVGTPGRMMDMQARRQIDFSKMRFVVLDEVDRMLDIGFRDDIRKIMKMIQCDHQTIFVSATIDAEIERLGRSFMKEDAQKIITVSGSLTVSQVEQKYLPVEAWDKRALLLHLLRHEKPETTLVFCRTKATVHKVTRYLCDKKIEAREIHGDLAQTKRNRVMSSLRKGNLNVLIASDLAARGLDVEHISHVINYDLPQDPEIYVHRIGRTARAGRAGVAWTFVTPEEGKLLTEVEKLAGVMIEKFDFPDFKPGPVPSDISEQRKRQQVRSDPMASLSERAVPPTAKELSEEDKTRMFPGGVVPKSPPPRTLGSRFRSRRRR